MQIRIAFSHLILAQHEHMLVVAATFIVLHTCLLLVSWHSRHTVAGEEAPILIHAKWHFLATGAHVARQCASE